ncbi:MAG: conjugal transfer protein TraF [Bacteroidales bacterium]
MLPTLLARRLRVLVCLATLVSARIAGAQTPESTGVRAQGLAGAFVAIADDVTATYWNPAGLSNAPLFDATLQRSVLSNPFDRAGRVPSDGGTSSASTFLAFAIPSFGVSVLRTVTLTSLPPTAWAADSRQQDRPGGAVVSRMVTTALGATLVQSLTGHLVAGTTVKAVRGSFGTAPTTADTLSDALDEAGELSAPSVTRFDVDAGVLGWAGSVRLALAARNLLAPRFSTGRDDGSQPAWKVGRTERQVRAGIAITPGFAIGRTAAAKPTLTISVDADLLRTSLPTGDERHLAAGIERWIGKRLALRGGARVNTVGDVRPVIAAGVGVAPWSRLSFEAFAGSGSASDRGPAGGFNWGAAARVSF